MGPTMAKAIENSSGRRHYGPEEALQRRGPQIPADGVLGRGLCTKGNRHPVPVSHHPAGRRRPDRSGSGRGRGVEHGHLDGGVDRPADGLRQLPGEGLQGRAGAEQPGPVLRLGGLRHHPVRRGLDCQHDGEPDRQCLQLQTAQGGAAGGHPVFPSPTSRPSRGPRPGSSSSASASTSSAGRCSAPRPSPSSGCPGATMAAWSTRASRGGSIS